ncbi:MAG: hypothetical protein AAF587_35185 [Bacteroidota bacterium]
MKQRIPCLDSWLHILIVLLMASHSAVFSQTPYHLVLPNEVNGTVQLNISAIPGLNPEKSGYEYVSVFVQHEGEADGSYAVQGRHTIEGEYLVFAPYFPWERGMIYVVRIKDPDTDHSYSYRSFQVAKKPAIDKAEVVAIYPSASELPENLLRFYLYFNTPMKKGQALEHIELTDASGNIDEHAFMEFKQELWSPDGKRLTLLFDPGRIKRGVSTNMELGPALLEGKRYQLHISAAWQDVYGQELFVKTTKDFVVGKAYRQSINLQDWGIHKPAANSYDPLRIHFDRIMDHALVQSMVQIEDGEQNLIPGHWEISEQEQWLLFIPAQAWQKGRYQIVIDSRLEDVAGNNLQGLLDQKQTKEENQGDTRHVIDFDI